MSGSEAWWSRGCSGGWALYIPRIYIDYSRFVQPLYLLIQLLQSIYIFYNETTSEQYRIHEKKGSKCLKNRSSSEIHSTYNVKFYNAWIQVELTWAVYGMQMPRCDTRSSIPSSDQS